MKARFIGIAVAVATCLLTASVTSAQAQSSDSANPEALTTSQIQGEVETGGQSHYYSFSGGPGDITVSFDGKTDFYSTTTHIVFSDSSGRELSDFAVAASDSGVKKVEKFHLASRQRLKMKVMFGMDVGVHLNYKISLGGAVSPSGTAIASKPKPEAVQSKSDDSDSNDVKGDSNSATTDDTTTDSAGIKGTEVEQAAESAPVEDKWALLVGVSKFANPTINLKYPAKDAKDLYTFLTTEAHFAPDHVKLLVDEQATKETVLTELGDSWLPRLARPNDLVLIFISSHGSSSKADLEGLNYLVMHNTDPERLYATGLPLADLANAIKHRVHSNRVVLIIDACHSGAASPSKGIRRVGNFDTDLLQGTGQMIICSSEQNQLSWESKRYQNGVFTRQFIEAMRSPSGKPTISQVFSNMKEAVQSEVLQDRKELQTAVMKSKWRGKELIISAPPAKPRPVPKEE